MRCAPRWRRSSLTGQLIVVKALDLKEPKTKQFQAALDALKVEGTVLVVEAAQQENRNLELSARKYQGPRVGSGNDGSPLSLAALRTRDLFARRTEQIAGLSAKVCFAT